MAQENDIQLFQEVHDAVRLERMQTLWRKYRLPLLSTLIGGTLATILILSWQWSRIAKAEKETLAYLTQVSSAPAVNATVLGALEAMTKTSSSGISVLAHFRLAAEKQAAGQEQDALKLYDAVKNNIALPDDLRAAAAIRGASLLVETRSPEELKAYLAFLDTPESNWRVFARELYALSAYRLKNPQKALALISENLKDPKLPPAMRQRHELFFDVLSPFAATPARLEGISVKTP